MSESMLIKSNLVDGFVSFKIKINVLDKTISEYKASVDKFIIWLQDQDNAKLDKSSTDNMLVSVTRKIAQSYVFVIRETLKFNSTKKAIAGILQLYNFIMMEMDLLGNAFSGLQVPKDSVTEIKEYISLKESNIILNSCESTQHRLLIGLAFKSGLRIQEISKIEVANIDLENKTIDVLRKGRRMRRLDIAAELINDLTIQVENCNALNHTFLFQGRRGIKPLTTKSIRDTFDGYLGKLDLNSDYVFHSLRKVYSTDLYYNENKTMHEISKLLDHSNTGITELYVLDKKYVEL